MLMRTAAAVIASTAFAEAQQLAPVLMEGHERIVALVRAEGHTCEQPVFVAPIKEDRNEWMAACMDRVTFPYPSRTYVVALNPPRVVQKVP